MASGRILGGPDIEDVVYDTIASVAPGALKEGRSKDEAVDKAKKDKEAVAAYKDTPGAGVAIRLGEGIKIDPAGKAEFVASVLGKGATREERIANGMSRVFQVENGALGYVDDSGQKRLVDQPTTKGQMLLAAGLLAGPLFPVAAAAVEAKYPGTLRETVGDIAGQAGNVIEMAPGVAMEALTRGKGSMLRQVGSSAIADFSGAPLRRAASAAIPGRDIGALDTANRGAVSALAGVGARAVTGIATDHPRLPGSNAPPSYMERRVGKRLLGASPDSPVVREALANEEKMGAGVVLSPAEMSLDLEAINQAGVLGQTAGSAETGFARELENTMATSRFVKKKANALVGANIPADEVGERLAGPVGKMRQLKAGLIAKRANYYKKGEAELAEEMGTTPFPTTALSAKRDDLIQRGILKETDALAAVPATESFSTLAQRVKDRTAGAYAGNAAPTVMNVAEGEMKEAALQDMKAGLGPRYAKYEKLRATYAEMSKPVREFDVELVADVLDKGSPTKLDFEHIPEALLNHPVNRQVEVALAIADKSSKGTANLWRRSAVEASLAKAEARMTSLEGTRLAKEGAKTGEIFEQADLANKALNADMNRLTLILGGGKQIESDLKAAADIFNRISLATKAQKGSQTYRMLDADKKLRSVANIIFSPLKTGDELTTILFRKRISELLANRETRNLLVGIEKTLPQDVGGRTFSTAVQRLASLVAREEYGDNAEQTYTLPGYK